MFDRVLDNDRRKDRRPLMSQALLSPQNWKMASLFTYRCNRETLVSLLITKNDISMCSVPIVVILTTVYCIYTKSEERQQYLRHFQKLLKLCDEWSLCDVIERLSSLISRLSKMHTGD